MKIVNLLLSSAAVLLSSCVSNSGSAIRPETQAALRGARIAAVHGAPAGFHVTTVGEAFGMALSGIAAGAVSGNPNTGAMIAGQQAGERAVANQTAAIQLSKDLQLPDPAASIARSLVELLAKQHGMKVIAVKDPMVTTLRPSKIAKSVPDADFILKVTTTGIGAIYGLLNPTKYNFVGGMKMQLVDVRTGKVVSSGVALVNGMSSKMATTNYDGILANNAAFVRQELDKFRVEAEAHFRKEILRL